MNYVQKQMRRERGREMKGTEEREGGGGEREGEEGEYIHRGQTGDFRWLEEAMGRLTSLAHRASFGMVITTRQR